MSLQETIWAQSAEAVGIPVLLRTGDDAADGWTHETYRRQSLEGSALLAGTRRADDGHRGRVLALNFHDIGVGHRAVVTEQLRRLADLGPSALLGEHDSQLTVLAVFYDGYRDAGLFGAQICLDLGITALYLPIFEHDEPARAQLDDADLSELAQQHRIGFHTHSHTSADEIDDRLLQREVVDPMDRLSRAAGEPPRFGAYCGGGRFDHRRTPDREAARLGVRWWLSNWSFEPTVGR